MGLSPRHRALLWVFATLLATAPLMGLTLILARVSEWPMIVVFAPAVLLGVNLGAQTPLHGVYYLMPVQCLVYGLLMAQAELSGKRNGTAIGLAIAHVIVLLRVLSTVGTSVPG